MVAITTLVYISKGETNASDKRTANAASDSGDKNNGNDSVKLVAYDFAAEFVTDSLQEPTTAEFPNTKVRLEHIEYLGEKRYRIDSWVDSQDTYGAMTRRNFSCIIKVDSSGVNKESLLLEEYGPVR